MIIKLEKCTIHVCDSLKELPADRHKDFQNLISQENNIGSDVSDIKKRASEVLSYLDKDIKAAKTAAMNIFFTISTIENSISYNQRSFAMLVKKYEVEGKEVTPGYSDDELDNTIQVLSSYGLTQEVLENAISESKKKSIEN